MADSFKTGNPIWVYYTDIDTGANLRVPQLLRGFVGTPFNIVELKFPNYRFIKADGQLNGSFDMQPHSVHLYYRRNSWGEVQNVAMYLKLSTPTQLFDDVDGMPVDTPLPGGIFVKTFQRIATQKGEFWYEVNADRWLKYDSNTMKDFKELPSDDSLAPKPGTQLAILPLNHLKAVVDYVQGKKLDVYDQPYGQTIGKVIDGERLDIIGKLNDNNGVVWYQAKDLGFINGSYVNLIQ
ncbi:MAG: MucBP domain-containing protein [Limosilactobacillus mucosae]|nr:MucBP domain-containing protein [Limosilactobacillus mucosae]